MVKFSAIAAVGKKMELGAGNDLLWHLPNDFKFFKATTMGAPIIMGRKTFESIGRPLPGRRNIVLTRDATWRADGVEVYASIETMAEKLDASKEHFVIGGAQIYEQFLPLLDTVYLTEVDAEFGNADAFFPVLEGKSWNTKNILEHSKDEKHQYNFQIREYTRK
jgi:dihydrofolate reductase